MACSNVILFEANLTQGQPSFLDYYQLLTRPNGTQLLASTNGVFQTGGVVGTLCLYDCPNRTWALLTKWQTFLRRQVWEERRIGNRESMFPSTSRSYRRHNLERFALPDIWSRLGWQHQLRRISRFPLDSGCWGLHDSRSSSYLDV